MTEAEKIKEKIDLVEFINEYVHLKKSGANFKALCPFHTEKTASFYVSPERQVWHCFGCSKGGDLFSFFIEAEKLEFPEALRVLAKKAGVELTLSYSATSQQRWRELIFQINHLMSEYYHYLLTKHAAGERARQYLRKRGMAEKIVLTFGLGYAPDSWKAQFRYLLKKGYREDNLEQAGLVIKGKRGYYDRFRGRLMFPISDQRGQMVGFAGRLLEDQIKEAKYINSPETAVYVKGNILYGLDKTKEAIKKAGSAILVEGEFDLLSSFQSGVTNVVAIKGSSLTEAQIKLVRRFTDKVIFALDSDLAGDEAARRGIAAANEAGLILSVAKLPVGKDPDECIRQDVWLWKKAIKEAMPIYDYLITSATRRLDPSTVEGKKRISEEILPILSTITNPIMQGHYTRLLAQILTVSEETVTFALKRAHQEQRAVPVIIETKSARPGIRQERLEETILAFLVQSEEAKLIEMIMTTLEETDFALPAFSKLMGFVKIAYEQEKKLPLSVQLKDLPQELSPILNRLILLPVKELFSERNFSNQVKRLLSEIKIASLRRKIRATATKIGQIEAQTDDKIAKDERLPKLNQELSLLSKGLKKAQQIDFAV